MLSKCANPGCGALFRYLTEGKVYVAEYYDEGDVCMVAGTTYVAGKRTSRREMFWLCRTCESKLTLTTKGNDVVAVPRGQVLDKGDQPLRELRLAG